MHKTGVKTVCRIAETVRAPFLRFRGKRSFVPRQATKRSTVDTVSKLYDISVQPLTIDAAICSTSWVGSPKFTTTFICTSVTGLFDEA